MEDQVAVEPIHRIDRDSFVAAILAAGGPKDAPEEEVLARYATFLKLLREVGGTRKLWAAAAPSPQGGD